MFTLNYQQILCLNLIKPLLSLILAKETDKWRTLHYQQKFCQTRPIPSVISGGEELVWSQEESSDTSGMSFCWAGISCHTLALGLRLVPLVVTCKIDIKVAWKKNYLVGIVKCLFVQIIHFCHSTLHWPILVK